MPIYLEKETEATVISEEYPEAGYLVMPKAIAKRTDLSLADKMLYALVFSFTSNNQECFASNGYIERQLDISQRTIQTGLQRLEKMGLIERKIVGRNERSMRVICNNLGRPSAKIAEPPPKSLHTYTQVYTQDYTQVDREDPQIIKNQLREGKSNKKDIATKEFKEYLETNEPYSKYYITLEDLELLAEKIDAWSRSKGKQVKNWKATARNWLLSDISGGKLNKRKPPKPTAREIIMGKMPVDTRSIIKKF